MKIKVEVGTAIDIGRNPKKKNQEDFVLCKVARAEIPRGLFILNDGIGGESAGEVASKMAAYLVEAGLSGLFIEPDGLELISSKVKEALVNAHNQIFESAQSNESRKGMGTTSVLLFVDGNKVYWAHVGNSRLYRLSENGLELLTKDHDQFQLAKETGLYEESEKFTTLKGLMGQFALMQALGDPDLNNPEKAKELRIAVKGEELSEGKFLYLLCSDGLTSTFPDSASEIPGGKYEKGLLEFCWPYLDGSKTAQVIADEILAATLEAEAQDNVSIVIVGLDVQEDEGTEATKRRASKLGENLKEEI